MRLILKAVLTILITHGVAWPANFETNILGGGDVEIYMVGDIEVGDAMRFTNELKSAYNKGQRVVRLVLNSHGGKLYEARDIAKSVRYLGLQTFIDDGYVCDSACFYAFAAGVERYMSPTARITVHRASDNGVETPNSNDATIKGADDLFWLYDVPEGIIGRLAVTASKGKYVLTRKDLESMNVHFVERQPAIETRDIERKPPTPKDRQRARSLNKEAAKLIDPHRVAEPRNVKRAIEMLTKAKELSPFDAEIAGNLGFAQYRNQDYLHSVETLVYALKVNGKRWATWQNVAMSLAELGKIDWATDCLIRYFEYSSNKEMAKGQFRDWVIKKKASPNLRIAAKAAASQLGIIQYPDLYD